MNSCLSAHHWLGSAATSKPNHQKRPVLRWGQTRGGQAATMSCELTMYFTSCVMPTLGRQYLAKNSQHPIELAPLLASRFYTLRGMENWRQVG